ncbi:MAG: chromosomal replication initiator protein DnaA [Hydrogenothermaceae bacterium]|nr:chromosomal replication initiator protein DnaA [Hydrogenothermaceae bacterium]
MDFGKNIAESKMWRSVLSLIKNKVDPSSMAILNSIENIYYNDGILYIYAPDKVFKDWLESEVAQIIEDTAQNIFGKKTKIHIVSQQEEYSKKTSNRSSKKKEEEHYHHYLTLNPKFTFENLVIGNCNKIAYTACLSVVENPGKVFNPLFIYGDVGLGKTHLLHATAYQMLKKNPTSKILYTTADTFTSELFAYIQRGKILDFRKKYIDTDLLLIDDMQFLIGKERTQIEFYHIFNVLYTLGKQIVLSSDQPPSKLEGIERRLTSRFASGLITEITKPDVETKVGIIMKKAKDIGISLPKDVILFLAKTFESSVRELEGSLKQLKAYYEIMGKSITLENARNILKDSIEIKNIQPITVEKIQQEVANHFNVNVSELLGNSRKKKVITARQVAMYLSRELTDESLQTISRAFKKKDHTTIINAIEKVKEEMEKDRKFSLVIEFLKDKLLKL